MCGLKDWPRDTKTDRLFSLEVNLITFKISGHRWQMGPRTELTLFRSAIKHRYPNDSIVIRGADLWPFRMFFFRLYICFFSHLPHGPSWLTVSSYSFSTSRNKIVACLKTKEQQHRRCHTRLTSLSFYLFAFCFE